MPFTKEKRRAYFNAPNGLGKVRRKIKMYRTRMWEAKCKGNMDKYARYAEKLEYWLLYQKKMELETTLNDVEQQIKNIPEYVRQEIEAELDRCN